MAGAAQKKQAQHNVQALKEIHIISIVVNLLSLLSLFLLGRPSNWKPYFVFSIPGWACEYAVERLGRPKYREDRGYQVLTTAGEDLRQAGLTEYMFDIFYLTAASNILMCLFGSNKVWWILLLVPIYAIYKLVGLWMKFRGSSARPSADTPLEEPKSKRQQKREARGNRPRYR
ncbi:DEKNAAC104139 [Brettanomyces naardenensis]|uniref:DEKNAAC104139 n=1 Tax=Brettanomyces naardenensis TaxID=13370 RepID=A0A448YQ38_BRENA|nr:DEKNAAC104139 [Brettanomyces naardenensis]